MKKIFTVFISIALFIGCISGINAFEMNDSIFEYEGKEIIIADENLDYATKRMIADFVAEDILPYSTYAINCILGHSLAYTTAAEVQHNVRTGGYNCSYNEYSIEFCTRNCGYIVKTILSSRPINDCHG